MSIAVVRKAKKKAILAITKGFRGRKKNCVDLATGPAKRSLMAQYEGRRLKRRTMKTEWIMRVSAFLRQNGLKYSTHIAILKQHLFEITNKHIDLRDISSILCDNPTVLQNVIDKINK